MTYSLAGSRTVSKKSKADIPESQSKHSHKCETCGHEWRCVDYEWGVLPLDKCKVTQAVKVNGQGPYCNPCRTAEMKRRVRAWKAEMES